MIGVIGGSGFYTCPGADTARLDVCAGVRAADVLAELARNLVPFEGVELPFDLP